VWQKLRRRRARVDGPIADRTSFVIDLSPAIRLALPTFRQVLWPKEHARPVRQASDRGLVTTTGALN